MAETLIATLPNDELRGAVRRGGRRTAIAQIASHIVSLAVLASLMRLVEVEDFGLIGMVIPVLLLLRIFTMLGMNVVTVQRQELSAALVSTLFWLHLVLGVATALATVALAPFVAWIYGQPELVPLTAALSGTSIAAALGLQHVALLERNLKLGRAASARLIAQIAGGIAGILVALAGHGVWALVTQQYVEPIVLSIVAWQFETWRPLRPRHGAPVRAVLHFSGYFTASSLVFYLMANIDKFLVGVLLGREALGLYSQAFNIMMKPVLVLTTPLTSLMLPALSRSAHDRPDYTRILLAFQRLLAVASFPTGLGLWIVGPEAMRVIGGPHWVGAGQLLSALALTIIAQPFINMAGTIFVSAGRWREMLAGALVLVLVLVQGLAAGYYLGSRQGNSVLGVAWGFSLTTTLVLFLPYMAYCLRLANVRFADWLQQLTRAALASVAMACVVVALRYWLIRQHALPPLCMLAIEVAVGVVAFVTFAWKDVRWCWEQLRAL